MNEDFRRTWLKNFFTLHLDGAAEIVGSDAIGCRQGSVIGIFIPTVKDFGVYKDSLNVMEMVLGTMQIHGAEKPGVMICCDRKDLTESFTEQCVQLLSPTSIKRISENPLGWWRDFKTLTGNVISERKPYFVFAEFITYLMLVKRYAGNANGVTVTWKSCGSNHDIESSDGVQHEVKSTISHHESFIRSSNDFQLKSTDVAPLMLYFCRIDNSDSVAGKSINDLVELAGRMGCDVGAIEAILEAQRLPSYSLERKIRYFPMQCLSYDVKDPRFPKFCHSDIPAECRPECIEDVTYKINLNSLSDISVDVMPEVLSLFP